MPEPLSSRIRHLLGIELDDLAGSFVAGELPIPEGVVNRLIAGRLAASGVPVSEARIEAHDDDRVTVRLELRGPRLLPGVTIAAQIEQQPSFPEPGVLALRWSMPGMGPLARFAGPALSLFGATPPGVRIEGDRAEVNIPEVLRSRGLGDLVRYIGGLRVHTRRGTVIVGFEAGVPPRTA
jgi:hypothetical protein